MSTADEILAKIIAWGKEEERVRALVLFAYPEDVNHNITRFILSLKGQ